MPKDKFLKLIEGQRKTRGSKKFAGVFLDYLELVSQNPDIAKLSHKRLYDVIVSHGVDEIDDSDEE